MTSADNLYRFAEFEAVEAPCSYTAIRMSSTSTTDTETVTITVRGEDTECTFDGMIMVNGVCVAAVICTEPMYLDEATNTCLDTPVCDTGSEWIAATNACEVPFTGEYFTITSSATVFQSLQPSRTDPERIHPSSRLPYLPYCLQVP